MTCPDAVPAGSVSAALARLPEAVRRHVTDAIMPLAGWSAGEAGTETIPDLRGCHLAFACRSLVYSGSGRVLIEQVAALAPTGATADLFCFEDGADPGVEEEIRRRCSAVRRIERVSRKLRARNSVLFETWPGRHALWISTDTQDMLAFSEKVRKFMLMCPPRLATILHEPYDRYLAVLRPFASEISALCLDYDFTSEVRTVFGPDVKTGIVAPLFPRADAGNVEKGSVRRELGIPADARVLGYAGRLGRNKRIERMLDILAALLAEGRDNVWLLLAGRWEEDSYRREVEMKLQDEAVLPSGRRIRLAERVRVAGPRPALEPVFADMDVFLLLSKAEGFYPLSVMEAQQAGLPVVCTPAGGLARVILDGVTGFSLPGENRSDGVTYGPDAASLATARVGQLLDDDALRLRMGETGREVVTFLTAHYPFARLFRRWLAKALTREGPA